MTVRKNHLVWRLALLLVGVAVLLLVATATRGLLAIYRFEAERRAGIQSASSEYPLLLDRNGDPIRVPGSRRVEVAIADIPTRLQDAVVAVEDARFYRHYGIDPVGILRALYIDLRTGRATQGASTITQQVARVLFLSQEKTLARKLQESVVAVLLEARYTKQHILELYLNNVYMGEGAYGVADAARTYLGKPLAELTLAEAALIAGLPQAPSAYNPFINPDLAVMRRNIVIQRMVQTGRIGREEGATAAAEPLRLAPRHVATAPYFVDFVSSQLQEVLGRRQDLHQLTVLTTLDLRMQEAARSALGKNQGAVVALDPSSGAIRAMVGGRDYQESPFNRATHAFRQPGSAFKPFVYASAIERGWRVNDLVEDWPLTFSDYKPTNFRDEYWGRVTLKQALTESLNNGTVWLLSQLGVEAAVELASRLGIRSLVPADRNLAVALGGLTKGVTPLELAGAYAPFANGGRRVTPYAIERVIDSRGKVIWEPTISADPVIAPETAFLVTDMLRAVIDYGTGTAAAIGRPAAGKTGTTDRKSDAWFVGYTPNLVATIFIGNDDGTPLTGGGGTLAAPVWGKFMAAATRFLPALDFTVPPGILTGIPVDIFTGLLAYPPCHMRELDAFRVGTVPTEVAPCAFGLTERVGPFIIDRNTANEGAPTPATLPSTLLSPPSAPVSD